MDFRRLLKNLADPVLLESYDACLAFTSRLKERFAYIQDRPLSIRRIANAKITRRIYDEANNTLVGAVYEATGALQKDTQRFSVGDIVPVDEEDIGPGPLEAEVFIDAAFYGGVLHPVLGHTIFETLARFWHQAIVGPYAGEAKYIFHHWPGLDINQIFRNPLYASFFRSVGVGPENVILADQNIKVGNLIVADKASIYHEFMHPIMGKMLERFRADIGTGSRTDMPKVFLSRSRWGLNKRIQGVDHLDTMFAELGYSIVFPETLDPPQLMTVLSGARHVAAVDGSHAHLFAFCDPGAAVIMLDTRMVPTQIAIEVLRNLRCTHVPLFDLDRIYSRETGDIINYPLLQSLISFITDQQDQP